MRCSGHFLGWHKWGRFDEPFAAEIIDMDGDLRCVAFQRRCCQRCGLMRDERAYVSIPGPASEPSG